MTTRSDDTLSITVTVSTRRCGGEQCRRAAAMLRPVPVPVAVVRNPEIVPRWILGDAKVETATITKIVTFAGGADAILSPRT